MIFQETTWSGCMAFKCQHLCCTSWQAVCKSLPTAKNSHLLCIHRFTDRQLTFSSSPWPCLASPGPGRSTRPWNSECEQGKPGLEGRLGLDMGAVGKKGILWDEGWIVFSTLKGSTSNRVMVWWYLDACWPFSASSPALESLCHQVWLFLHSLEAWLPLSTSWIGSHLICSLRNFKE